MVLRDAGTTVVLVTVDAVALAEIGPIPNDYLPNVRRQLQAELGIDPANVLVNASHCHGVVCPEVVQRTVDAVRAACEAMVPVRVGTGRGHEDRIQENRRLRLRDGPGGRAARLLLPDAAVDAGPIDPQIGILRLDRRTAGRWRPP